MEGEKGQREKGIPVLVYMWLYDLLLLPQSELKLLYMSSFCCDMVLTITKVTSFPLQHCNRGSGYETNSGEARHNKTYCIVSALYSN